MHIFIKCTVSFCVLYVLRTLVVVNEGRVRWKKESFSSSIPLSGAALGYHGCNEGSFISISAQSHHSHMACSSPGLRMSVYCLRDGPLCMCCLRMDAGRDAETDLLMYLLSGMSEIGQIWYERANVFCVWSALWGQTLSVELDQWTRITSRGQVK